MSQTALYASAWEKLDPKLCRAIYSNGTCSGLREYRNVVVVAGKSGWKRSDIWEMSTLDDDLWEPIVPRDELNTLWHSQQCTMSGIVNDGTPECSTTCGDPFAQFKGNYTWLVDFQSTIGQCLTSVRSRMTANFESEDISKPIATLRRQDLNITHCLAEPRNSYCAVAVSNPLLFGVALSVFIKVVICITIFWGLGPVEPIVTPGDAIASFISDQDGPEFISGLMTHYLARSRARSTAIYKPLEPRKWEGKKHHRASSVPGRVWFRAYSVFILGILVTFLISLNLSGGLSL